MTNIRMRNPTGRNTQCRVVHIGDVELYFSYDTLVAAADGSEGVRLHNSWGPTTGRHFRELGITDWPEVSETHLTLAVSRMLRDAL